jgi:hypothetical protein
VKQIARENKNRRRMRRGGCIYLMPTGEGAAAPPSLSGGGRRSTGSMETMSSTQRESLVESMAWMLPRTRHPYWKPSLRFLPLSSINAVPLQQILYMAIQLMTMNSIIKSGLGVPLIFTFLMPMYPISC